MKLEKLPLEMSLRDLKNMLGDLGFDPKLFIVKILAEESNKVAIVKIVEVNAMLAGESIDLRSAH